jgi:hypothetical protein
MGVLRRKKVVQEEKCQLAIPEQVLFSEATTYTGTLMLKSSHYSSMGDCQW